MAPDVTDADVIVVGGGNAALTAALAARDRGRSVILLERAPKEQAGGNSYYTAGATRIVHDGLEDLLDLVEPDERHDRTEVPPYTAQDYLDDLAKVTEGRSDPEMGRILAEDSADVLRWLRKEHDVRYRLMYERQAYERPDGSYLFWGGLHVGNVGGGEGLIRDEVRAAERAGVDLRYEHHVVDLVTEGDAVTGVVVRTPDGERTLRSRSVILASGGFEANAELRERYLGPGWQHAKVRGTPFNTGELILKALELGAARGGDWSSCHSVQWDAWTEQNESNRELTNRLTRQSYILGIIVNKEGERFVDEGADYRNYTYAKYGADVLAQPDSIAFQLFDATLRPMLRSEEYEMPGIGEAVADTLEELAEQLGVDVDGLVRTVRAFNDSIDRDVDFDPNVKDGRAARVDPPKSNWANPIETAPFYAYPVTCGVTFTFGGLKGDSHGRVLKEDGDPIPGLFACGEALGGLFSGNYPGGSGLAAGAVFGRRAGSVA
jgi:tricarballylate dehydrogenase